MKKFTISIMMLLLAVPMVAVAAKRDSLLLSKVQSDNKVVERYLVRNAESGEAEFEMMFPINNSSLQTTFADNSNAVSALNRFAQQIADTTMHVTTVKIVGYASPDGIESKNETLAAARARATEDFVVNHCNVKNILLSSRAYVWSDCIPIVENMAMEDKDAVIAILSSGSHSEMEKQAELMKMPQVWMIFKNTILPSMRNSELTVTYTKDNIVEKSYVVAPPQPAPQPVAEAKTEAKEKPYPVAVVETDETGIIVEVPQKERHHRRKNR